MDVDTAEEESHALKRSRVTAVTIGGRLAHVLM